MSRLINRLEVSDVSPKLTKGEWRMRLVAFAIGALGLFAFAIYAYTNVYLPYTWRSQVSLVVQEIKNLDQEDADRLLAYPEMIKLELLAERLTYGPKGMDLPKRIVGFKAALELADHMGSPAARYIYGNALLSGRVGMTDKQQAVHQFELSVQKISDGVNKGDARSTFYYALMLNAGQGGLDRDASLSTSMIKQVMSELSVKDLRRLEDLIDLETFVVDRESLIFGSVLLKSLSDRGEDLDPYMIARICEKTSYEDLAKNCIRNVARSQASKTTKLASSNFGISPSPMTVDSERQSFTGYIKGSPQAAIDGLSTFSIDNKQGSSDAVGRLYKNGAKPAVRSIYVKAGETFKAQSLTAGSYIFRYRFIGSEATFEADKDIKLSESRTATGTQFSNVTVTLHKDIGGNLHMKQVSPSDF